MRLFQVWNGQGLEFTVSADRCADISRLKCYGINMGYFSPNGYVAPSYYDDRENGFLKSFTAGFLTTCGLTAVGTPCEDEGEKLPLHGTIGNAPAERIYWKKEKEWIRIYAQIPDEGIFSHKLTMNRIISCSLSENIITIEDSIENRGDKSCPLMILYHINVGYPLLSEYAHLYIPSETVTGRDAHAQEGISQWQQITKPQVGFQEQCFFHTFKKEGMAQVFNPAIGQGIEISFDIERLPYFTQWKMMGVRDYVLGLEPGNCHPDGRDKMRREGKLTILEPGENMHYEVKISMIAEEK